MDLPPPILIIDLRGQHLAVTGLISQPFTAIKVITDKKAIQH